MHIFFTSFYLNLYFYRLIIYIFTIGFRAIRFSSYFCKKCLNVYRCIQYENETSELFNNGTTINIDQCNKINAFNQTLKCEAWSFDNTYHEQTRATQVNKKIIIVIANTALLPEENFCFVC